MNTVSIYNPDITWLIKYVRRQTQLIDTFLVPTTPGATVIEDFYGGLNSLIQKLSDLLKEQKNEEACILLIQIEATLMSIRSDSQDMLRQLARLSLGDIPLTTGTQTESVDRTDYIHCSTGEHFARCKVVRR